MVFRKYKKIKVDNGELSIIVKSLNDLRNKLIQEGEDIELINDLMLKYICILEK